MLASLGFVAFLLVSAPALAANAPPLGTAASYTVLGTNPTPVPGTVTCTTSTINGNVGTTFNSIQNTGCTINGAIDAPVLPSVVADFNNGYSALETLNPTCDGTVPTVSTILPPGVYCSAAGTTIGAGVTLTLNGSASDVWVFKIGTSGFGALTGNSFQVVLGGSAQACNVYWRTAEAATLNSSNFIGTILAGSAITLTGGNYVGRAMAKTDVTVTSEAPMTFAGCAPLPPVCPITLSPATLPTGTVGVAYSQTIVGSGGTGPYSFAVTAGALPAGLTLTPAGVLSGTPTTNDFSAFTIRATDATGCTASVAYAIAIAAGGPVQTLHEVSTCGTLASATSFILTADLHSTGTCLTIAGNGVSLDLNGHSISGSGVGVGILALGNNMTIKGPGIIHDFGAGLVLGNHALVQDVLVYNSRSFGIRLGDFSKCVQCRVHDVLGGEVDGIGISMGLGCLLESSIVETSNIGAIVGRDCKVWDLVVDTVLGAGLVVGRGTSVARTVISHYHDGPGLDYTDCTNATPSSGAAGCQDSSNSVSVPLSPTAPAILDVVGVTTDCATNAGGLRYPGNPIAVNCPTLP